MAGYRAAMRRYGVTGDAAALDQAVEHLEARLRSPDSGALMALRALQGKGHSGFRSLASTATQIHRICPVLNVDGNR